MQECEPDWPTIGWLSDEGCVMHSRGGASVRTFELDSSIVGSMLSSDGEYLLFKHLHAHLSKMLICVSAYRIGCGLVWSRRCDLFDTFIAAGSVGGVGVVWSCTDKTAYAIAAHSGKTVSEIQSDSFAVYDVVPCGPWKGCVIAVQQHVHTLYAAGAQVIWQCAQAAPVSTSSSIDFSPDGLHYRITHSTLRWRYSVESGSLTSAVWPDGSCLRALPSLSVVKTPATGSTCYQTVAAGRACRVSVSGRAECYLDCSLFQALPPVGRAPPVIYASGNFADVVDLTTARVLKTYPLRGARTAWLWPPRLCSKREYEITLAAVDAIDAIAIDAAAEQDATTAVGLVRAVLLEFVAEDARIIALQF